MNTAAQSLVPQVFEKQLHHRSVIGASRHFIKRIASYRVIRACATDARLAIAAPRRKADGVDSVLEVSY
jgi:hypothetical protein